MTVPVCPVCGERSFVADEDPGSYCPPTTTDGGSCLRCGTDWPPLSAGPSREEDDLAPLVEGGQGRDPIDVRHAALGCLCAAAGLVVVGAVILLWPHVAAWWAR